MKLRMNRFSIPLLLLACLPARGEELVIGTYNVENLFDAEDEPGRDDFGPADWDEDMLDAKLTNLARAVRSMNDGRGPDVLGLCEVENRAVVVSLVARLGADGRRYRVVHRDSPDERGIDCALVYDAAVFDLAGERFHGVTVQPTRDILEAELEADGEALFVFMNHWPSQRNPEADRIAAAGVLRRRVDEILRDDPDADIICLGDFNEESDEPALTGVLRTVGTAAEATAGRLLNSSASIGATADRGTFVFDEEWGLIDHILLSRGLLTGPGLKWKEDSTEALRPDFLIVDPPGSPIERPHATRSGSRFDGEGTSDHLPLRCILVR